MPQTSQPETVSVPLTEADIDLLLHVFEALKPDSATTTFTPQVIDLIITLRAFKDKFPHAKAQ